MPRYMVQRTFPDGLHTRSPTAARTPARRDRAELRGRRNRAQEVWWRSSAQPIEFANARSASAMSMIDAPAGSVRSVARVTDPSDAEPGSLTPTVSSATVAAPRARAAPTPRR